MRVYKVGGAVRDHLIGRHSHDADYVVIGETPESMKEQGFKQVGADFPVFLHPKTKEEYALARTEKKTGVGYKGFSFDFNPQVSLEEDLIRRDFTINAMALDNENNLIDPYGGRRDLSLRVLRHVSTAFVEDPLRVLRAARIAAQLNFEIAPKTKELMNEIVQAGEIDNLTPERVWLELQRGLATQRPGKMLMELRNCGALKIILPEIDHLFSVEQNKKDHPEGDVGTHTLLVLHTCTINWWPVSYRWACLMHDIGKGVTEKKDLPNHPNHEAKGVPLVENIAKRLAISKKVTHLAIIATREHGNIHKAHELSAKEIFDIFMRIAAYRDVNNLNFLLAVADCDHAAHPDECYYDQHPNHQLVMKCFNVSLDLNLQIKEVQEAENPKAIIEKLRVGKIQEVLENLK